MTRQFLQNLRLSNLHVLIQVDCKVQTHNACYICCYPSGKDWSTAVDLYWCFWGMLLLRLVISSSSAGDNFLLNLVLHCFNTLSNWIWSLSSKTFLAGKAVTHCQGSFSYACRSSTPSKHALHYMIASLCFYQFPLFFFFFRMTR